MNEVRDGIESASPFFWKDPMDYIEIYTEINFFICPKCGLSKGRLRRRMHIDINSRKGKYGLFCPVCHYAEYGKTLGEAVDKYIDLLLEEKAKVPEVAPCCIKMREP